MNGKVKHILTR